MIDGPGASRRVLVASDDESNRSELCTLLERAGYVVVDALDAATARGRWGEADVVVLDTAWGSEDPYALCRTKKGRYPSTPVITLIPPGADSGARIGALEAGSDLVLQGRFEPEELLAAVRAAVRNRSLVEELQRAVRERDEAVAQLDALFDCAPVGLAFVDRELRFRRVNPGLATLNGLTPEAHLGHVPTELLPNLEGLEELLGTWRLVIESGEPLVGVEVTGETPAHPGRKGTWLESFYPVRVRSEVIGLGIVAQDITDRKAAEEVRQRLLAIVGHDLRNPLASVQIGIERALSTFDLPERARGSLERALRSVHRMTDIIHELLDYSQTATGGVALNPVPCDLHGICQEAMEDVGAASPDRPIQYVHEGDGRGEWDPPRLYQILTNLLTNAIRHSRPDDAVRLSWKGLPYEKQIEVFNSGPAIPQTVQARMFEPFQRGEENPAVNGLGLGLFIVRELVSAHRGSVEVESRDGHGTTVRVKLPTKVEPLDDRPL